MINKIGTIDETKTSLIGEKTAAKVRESFSTLERVYDTTKRNVGFITQISSTNYELGKKLIQELLEYEDFLRGTLEKTKKSIYRFALRNIQNRGDKDFFYGMIQYERHFEQISPFINDIGLLRYPRAKIDERFKKLISETKERVENYSKIIIGEVELSLYRATQKDLDGKLLLSDIQARDLFQ